MGQPCIPSWVLPRGMFTVSTQRFNRVDRVQSARGLSVLPLTACAFSGDQLIAYPLLNLRRMYGFAPAATWFGSCELVDPQLVCAVSQHKSHERHDSVETLTAHSVARDIMDQTLVVMSDQEPVF